MQYDRKVQISVGTGRKAVTWNRQELYWSEFVMRLSLPVRTPESFQQYKSLPKPEQDC